MNKKFLSAILVFCIMFTYSCTTARSNFKRQTVQDTKTITGAFSLILFGNRFADDFKTIAVMDLEGDKYTLEPFVPEYDYTVKKHLGSREALNKGMKFVSKHESFKGIRISRILDNQGDIIGYELRPFYRDLRFRTPDALYVDYIQKNGKVIFYIRLRYEVEKFYKRDTLGHD